MAQSEIGAGDVTITLGGSEFVLTPSLQACMTLAGGRGGITGLTQRCLELEFDAIYSVVLAGLAGKGWKSLKEDIYLEGLVNLSAPCILFLQLVANGGQPLAEASEDDDEDDDPLANSSQ